MKIRSLVRLLAVSMLAFAGCDEDETTAPAPPPGPPNTGTANFTRYVAVGDAHTAGFQSNALSARDQVSSYPALIAGQVQTGFDQPLFIDPGVGSRQRLVSLTGPVIVSEQSVFPANPQPWVNLPTPPRPYNNLGIPGAVTGDLLFTTNFAAQAAPPRSNPFFLLILRDSVNLGRTVLAQARLLQPTFVTLWIGNNDVLGYVTSGGTSGSDATRLLPTEGPVFDALFARVLDSLLATGAKVVAANLPDVEFLPFVTTVNPSVRPKLPAGVWLRYQKSGNSGPAFDSTRLDQPGDPSMLLSGNTYAGLLGRVGGQGAGKFYQDRGLAPPPGIDTTKPFGFHPQNPWPNALTFDSGEKSIANAAVTAFNGSITTRAAARGVPVVNLNRLFDTVTVRGVYVPGFGSFGPAFITGGTYSYDGVHPTSRGYALVANEFIKTINASFGAAIPQVPVGSAPGIPIGKVAVRDPQFGDLSWMVRLLGGG